MFEVSSRRRLRPSLRSLGLSILVCVAALLLMVRLFSYPFAIPLIAIAIVASSVSWVRRRTIVSGLPPPYGQSRISVVNAKSSQRSALLLMVGILSATVVLFGTAAVLPPEVFFSIIFGLMIGLPLAEIVTFVGVSRIEGRSRSNVYSITDERGDDGEPELVKSVELIPKRDAPVDSTSP